MRDSSPLIVDCHLDLAWNALGYKRDLTLPLAELNRGEQGLADHAERGLATTTLPEMRTGGVGLCLATLIARTRWEQPQSMAIAISASPDIFAGIDPILVA